MLNPDPRPSAVKRILGAVTGLLSRLLGLGKAS